MSGIQATDDTPSMEDQFGETSPVQAEELLREFAKDVIRQSWDGSLDEPYVQELGVKLGLLKKVTFDPAIHSDVNAYAEAGDPWYIFDGPLLATLAPIADGGAVVAWRYRKHGADKWILAGMDPHLTRVVSWRDEHEIEALFASVGCQDVMPVVRKMRGILDEYANSLPETSSAKRGAVREAAFFAERAMLSTLTHPAPAPGPAGEALAWAVERWNAEVKNRPLVNVHRRSLDDAWRQVMRHFGGDPDALVGPSHDELLEKSGVAAMNAETSWRCFHCDEVFIDRRCAADHFGASEDCESACQIKMGAERSMLTALRRAEQDAANAWQAIQNETTDAAKAYFAQNSRHQEQLRIAEELGFDRGVAAVIRDFTIEQMEEEIEWRRHHATNFDKE